MRYLLVALVVSLLCSSFVIAIVSYVPMEKDLAYLAFFAVVLGVNAISYNLTKSINEKLPVPFSGSEGAMIANIIASNISLYGMSCILIGYGLIRHAMVLVATGGVLLAMIIFFHTINLLKKD